MKKLILIVLAMILVASPVFALGPKIDKDKAVWDQNTETDLAGYYLYWRTQADTFSDTNRVQVLPTNKASPTHTAPSFNLGTLNLTSGNYSIAISAYDTAGNESGLSTEAPFDASLPANPSGLGVGR